MDQKIGYAFDPIKHVHTYNGKRMHGVTSVLGHWGNPGSLVNWAANQAVDYITNCEDELTEEVFEEARKAHLKKRDKAGERGTEVHAELEVMMNNIIGKKFGEEYSPITSEVLSWLSRENITPLHSEYPIYSLEHFYGGIADGVVEREGKRYILDFKTSNSIQTKAFIQCAAYSVALKEMRTLDSVDGVVVVHIPKGERFDPEKNTYWFYNISSLEDAWLSILRAYKVDYELQKLIKY